jgi:hypothetical protein
MPEPMVVAPGDLMDARDVVVHLAAVPLAVLPFVAIVVLVLAMFRELGK